VIKPMIHSPMPHVSASKLLEKLGTTLEDIRVDHDLSYIDLGRELAKHSDQAGKYCRATAEMPSSTLLRVCNLWRGRLNPVFALIGLRLTEVDGSTTCDRRALTIVSRAQAEMAENLEDDNQISDSELLEDRAWIEAAGSIFDGWRQRLSEIDKNRP